VRIADRNWMQIEEYLRGDDRAVVPLGSTEQHAHLSLATDTILAERVAVEAAEPLGVPVFPPLAYGFTPYFAAYPGTVSLRLESLLRVAGDVLDGLAASGFRRIVIVNGHGGNGAVQSFAAEWTAAHPGGQVRFHNWWNAPMTIAQVRAFDPVASHASWMENFPWTRLPGVASPDAQKPMTDTSRLHQFGPDAVRAMLGDGNFGGRYQRADEEMLAIWEVAVEETREVIAEGWA
jgi:creatinine amidohydrolase